MNPPLIILSVFGGLVQDIFCSIPDAQVVLVDWDQDPDPVFPRDELVHGNGGCTALVGSFDARSIDDLANTDEEAAILEAQEKGMLDDAIFVVS